MKHLLLVVGLISACGLPAQEGPIRGPVVGYIFDKSHSAVRPILGIPGASTLGKPLDHGFAAVQGAVAPSQEFALLVRAEDGIVHLALLSQGTGEPRLLEGVPAKPVRIVFSPDGAAAAFFYESEESRRLVVVTGLPSEPVVQPERALAALPPAFAVADDGYALAAFSGEETLDAFEPDGGHYPLNYTGKIAAIGFLHRSRQAVAASSSDRKLFTVSADGVLSEGIAVTAPVALSVSRDNQRVVVVENESSGVTELDLSTGETRVSTCPCAPTSVERMAANALFRLNELSRGPLWLLDSGARETRLVFVPPDPVEEAPEP